MTRCRTATVVPCARGRVAALLLSCGGDKHPRHRWVFALANSLRGAPPGHGHAGDPHDEKTWLRLLDDELYSLVRQVPKADPARYATAVAYFNVLRHSSPRPTDDGNGWRSRAAGGLACGSAGAEVAVHRHAHAAEPWTTAAGSDSDPTGSHVGCMRRFERRSALNVERRPWHTPRYLLLEPRRTRGTARGPQAEPGLFIREGPLRVRARAGRRAAIRER